MEAEVVVLTDREEKVASLIAKGLSNPQVSKLIGKSVDSVKRDVRLIFDKIGIDTRLQLAIWYTERNRDEQQAV